MEHLCPNCGSEHFVHHTSKAVIYFCSTCGREATEERKGGCPEPGKLLPLFSRKLKLKVSSASKREKIKPIKDKADYLPRRRVR